jgi:hypothetical protein
VLHGDTEIVQRRISNRQSISQNSVYLNGLQGQLRKLYHVDGTIEWRSTEWSIETLVRHFSSLVYNEPYGVVDLQNRLLALADQRT